MLGFYGLGLRPCHYSSILETLPSIDWFEILSENYLVPGGKDLYFLDKIADHYPLSMHGVSLSIGSTDPLNWDYLKQIKQLAKRINPLWISDHLCWTGAHKQNTHDLLPLPYTFDTIQHVVTRLKEVQDFLEQPIVLENVSSYLSFKENQLSEWEFIKAIANEANCQILLDINNIYVNSYNHGFNALDYLEGIPIDKVKQFHLAGHTNMGSHILDTHDSAIIDPVWELYKASVKRFGKIPTSIERDDHIPSLSELLEELEYAKNLVSTF